LTKCSFYSAALSCGIAGGIIISGWITIHKSWRVIYFLASGLIWLLVLVVFFTMPETAYQREIESNIDESEFISKDTGIAHVEFQVPAKKSYVEQLQLFSSVYTNESLLTLFWRPVPLVLIPSVLFGTLSMSVCIGSFVAISSNYATAFTELYGFSTWQCGISYLSVLIGALVGIYGGGWLSDKVADKLTQRKSGLREPEMRLPTLTISLILAPLSLILYGVGIQYSLHWIVPILGLGLRECAIISGIMPGADISSGICDYASQ
jgi:MFS family permease